MLNKISKYLIYLLVISIPFTHKEMFSIFDPDLVISKFFLILVSVLGIFYFSKNYSLYLKDKLFVFLSLIVLFQLLSLLQSRDIMNSIRMIFFQGAILFSYPTFKEYIISEKGSISRLVNVYKYTFLFVFAFLLYQMYLQETKGIATGGVWPVPGYPTRYGSVFWDVNHFAAYLSSLFFIVLASLLATKKRAGKYFDFVLIILIGISLYFTSSRSATIGFAFGLLSFMYIYIGIYKKIRFKFGTFTWAGIAITFVTLPLSILYLFQDIIRQSFLYRSVSFFSHLFLMKVGINVGLENFLFGIGTNSFHAYFHTSKWANAYYYIDKAALSYKLPLHNLWLEVFAETGVFALICFILFWVLLLYMLSRSVSAKTLNLTSVGFFAGIISFLVGGVMYSYKSEFFWIYVVIACAYVTYHFKNIDLKLPTFNLPTLYSFATYVFIGVSFLLPLFYLMSPITYDEMLIIYSEKSLYFLDLFRYILGNFSFTDRSFSLIFYIGSILLLFGIFRKTCKGKRALVSTAIAFNLINIFVPGVYVSTKWIVCFFVLVLMSFGMKFLKLTGHFVCHLKWANKSVYAFVLILSFLLAMFSANSYSKKYSYDSDLSFLLELASNRLLFEKSSIWVDSSVDLPLAYYYCDSMSKKDGVFSLNSCDINVLNKNAISVANAPKLIIIGKSDFIDKISILGDEFHHGENYLKSGEYMMSVLD